MWIYLTIGVILAVLGYLLYRGWSSGRKFVKMQRECFDSLSSLHGEKERKSVLTRSQSELLRSEAAYRKKAGKGVIFICGKCGNPFQGWHPILDNLSDVPLATGFQGQGPYSSNLKSTNKKDGVHVEDRDGPVGACPSCWLLFCGQCAQGREFFVEGSFVQDVPIYDCPLCGSTLQIDYPKLFAGHEKQSDTNSAEI